MIILDVNKLTKSYGFGQVLDNISFTVNENERIAIVGENGCGKSTLLKIIAGLEKKDSGQINIKKDCVLEYLEQGDVSDSKTGTCIEILNSAFEKLNKLKQELNSLENMLSSPSVSANELDVLVRRYSNLQEKFCILGGYEIDVQINTVVTGLKIEKEILNREFSTLSGGERTLINFAKILLSKPDLLLLDEPTNHFDIERLEWLENYINSYKGSIIIVSHDRYFLDKVSKKIFELENGKIKIYHGNYSSYLEQKENEEVNEFQIYKVEQRKIQEMEKAIKRLKEWGKISNNPMFFRRAKAIESNMIRLKENAMEKPKEIKYLPIKLNESSRGSQEVVTIKNLNLTIGNKTLLTNANSQISVNEKVFILGENGCGKSTLINEILTNKNPNIKVGSNLNIAYLSQIINFENPKQNLLEYFINETSIEEQISRSILFNFQFFKNDLTKRVSTLSGGDKIRLKLAVLLQQKINFLILDEPTNHIDIPTREVLEETLIKFKGTLLIVSHDRFFINKIANKIIYFKNNKLLSFYGNYDEFLKNINKIH